MMPEEPTRRLATAYHRAMRRSAPPDASPPPAVLRAFALSGAAEALDGWESVAWRVGGVVLKRVDVSPAQLEWQASLFDWLQRIDSFRVPRAVRAGGGALAVDGWYATTYLSGRHEAGRWVDIVEVGDAFHSAVSSVRRPSFLDDRTDPWSIGDRVAWGELPLDDVPETKHLERLVANLGPIDAPAQLIHGDLTGNVLFDEGLPPAVLDLSPYFRPAGFASAIVVADALVWEGADASILRSFAHQRDFPQYLLRALIYRTVTDRLFRLDQPIRPDDDDPYLSAVDLAIRAANSFPG
jgi:uncharacterized protein (TIGR02569 family)